MGEPSSYYAGPQLVIQEINLKVDTPTQIVKNIQAQIIDELKTVATWTGDKPDGELTTTTLNLLEN